MRSFASRAALLVAAGLLGATRVMAQAAAVAAPAPADPCAGAPDGIPAELLPMMERFLTPGQAFSVAGLPPATLARAMALQQQGLARRGKDWPDLCHYRAQNAQVRASGTRPEVVFLGDSITEYWKLAQPDLFGPGTLDRGISGQTTSQILLRVYPDVVALRPRVVHILAGTNDVAGNTGPVPDDVIVDNIRAMIDILRANGIRVVLASITPVDSKDRPAARIAGLNVRLRALAAEKRATYLDYYPALAVAGGGIDPAYANDGLHPNRAGYALMRPLAERAIAVAKR